MEDIYQYVIVIFLILLIILWLLQNYTAPFEKILIGGDILKYIGKKPSEYEKLCKYGAFCMKLLRYCIEALSKGKKQANGKQNQEDCFKCAIIGEFIKCIVGIVCFPLIKIYIA